MKTDTQIQQDVLAELKWEPSVNAAHIGVEVTGGIVTLAGHVDSYAEKWATEQAAQRVSGVKAVVVEMDVKLHFDNQRSDADVAQAVENALAWSAYLPANRVQVQVEKGWVTLTGDLEWEYQRQSAQAALRHLMGVVGVSNNIALQPAVTQGDVKTDIEAALNRRATEDARKIQVEVHGDQVTLSGMVHSWDERTTARYSAWNTQGVRNVVDNIAVAY
jgi:osmotically-inducible protein OsmY